MQTPGPYPVRRVPRRVCVAFRKSGRSLGCPPGALAGTSVALGILFPWSGSRLSARRISCMSNAKEIATAIATYIQDFDDRLPVARQWCDGITPYVPARGVFFCPSD